MAETGCKMSCWTECISSCTEDCGSSCVHTCEVTCRDSCLGCSGTCENGCWGTADAGLLTSPDWKYHYSVSPEYGETMHERLEEYRKHFPQTEEDRLGYALGTPRVDPKKKGKKN